MRILLFVIYIFLSAICVSCPLKKIKFISEEFPPYNYMTSDGVIKGIAVDVLVAASRLVNCAIGRNSIEILPWARGYKNVLVNANTSLFSMSFSKERSKLFLWAGPFAKTKNVLIAKKDSGIIVDDENPLTRFMIGAIRNDISHQLALKAGAKPNNFSYGNKPENLAKMLYKGRIDAWAYNYITARWIFRKLQYSSDEFEIVYNLSENDNFFAFNKDSDKKAVELLQEGINMLKENKGKYGVSQLEEIVSNYL
ncbi:transporter substrate-binding domain-containing protein [Endozoicomonas sp. SM1973]|uniref:Transporter substrate-binding domain-containing protein n=1 Tax=Spartinivicinus marinus TaxID=2994442 RepID=A0A853IG58_9GAMM|nr:transporter substrate-binding domain-containing protein [Spartinivicinus marinus]MCX4025940.1 transporter substrate-binding domain-containing protein [Spartinivicinus marinus]NYZ68125.1 transporter substrate-binding domain-containing protein [Spartinivicinus marinus]